MTEARARIDTKEGITEMLAIGGRDHPLVGFSLLVRERARYRKQNPDEDLNEWLVMNGRYSLDKYGQTWTMEYKPDSVGWVAPAEPRPGLQISWVAKAIPRDLDRCSHCDGPITVRDIDHLHVGHYDSDADQLSVWHQECRLFWLDELHRNRFTECFADALGDRLAIFCSMPSQYHETAIYGPWYRVQHPKLGRLTVGCRKSVIHLGWGGGVGCKLANVDADTLFADENVTTGGDFVHAWGYPKLTAYLKRLAEAIP